MTSDTWDDTYAHGGHGMQHGGGASSPELAGFLAASGASVRRAVDIGCGTGADAVFLAGQGIATTGVDFSAVAIEHARRRASEAGVDVEWVVGDVLSLPLADASVDLATDRGCLHHVAASDQPRYAAEVARVLREGGTLLIRDLSHGHVGHGHHGPAVSEDSVRAMIDGLPLEIASIVPFEMGGRPATMLAVVRT